MVAGARVEVAPYKKDAADFVLWKPSSDDQPGWPSPWGRGRPGWHIECSAMIEKHLGETIDIHGGGIDLAFPHHENELAQSTCAHGGHTLARYWMHNGFLSMDKEKMSKSLGNVRLVHDMLDKIPGEVIRYVLLGGHYRQPIDWNDEAVAQARRSLDRLYGALRSLADVTPAQDVDAPEAFMAALLDDLNTPKALAELFALAKQANVAASDDEKARVKAHLLASGAVMGLLDKDPDVWFQGEGASDGVDGEEVDRLIALRTQARADKDFAEADRVRDVLAGMGVVIEDGAGGTIWRKAE